MPMISDGILGCAILMGGLLSMKCVCFSVPFAMIAYLFMYFVEYNSSFNVGFSYCSNLVCPCAMQLQLSYLSWAYHH